MIDRLANALVAATVVFAVFACSDEASDDDPNTTAGTGGAAGMAGAAGTAAGAGGTDIPLDERCPAAPANLPTDITETPDAMNPSYFTLGDFRHPMLPDPVKVKVLLPEGYSTATRYPVVYVHDGQALAKPVGTGIAAAMAAGVPVQPHIVVGIESALGVARVTLLTPYKTSGASDGKNAIPAGFGGNGEFLSQLMVETIKPYIDSKYSTKCGRANTAVMGYSLGGLMCLYQVVKHPDVFGRGHCISGAHWWDGEHAINDLQDTTGLLPLRLWLDVGGGEDPHTDAVIPNRRVRDVALMRGMILGDNLGYYEEPDKTHAEGQGRLMRLPWTLWSLADLEHKLPDSSATATTFTVEIPVTGPPPNPPADTGVAECSISKSFPGGYMLTVPNSLATFTSSDPAIATVDATGHIAAVTTGMVTIEADVAGTQYTDTFDSL